MRTKQKIVGKAPVSVCRPCGQRYVIVKGGVNDLNFCPQCGGPLMWSADADLVEIEQPR